ncbi:MULTISPECIES: DUF2218 domain-containing protein [Rhizobium/Agrobacterium group]|jgi:NADPH-dependent ferric siderophore reductase|nr:siderophore-interacting protein [Rhizobium rosettiformans]
MTKLSSRASVLLPEPEKHLEALAQLMEVHDIAVTRRGKDIHGQFRFGEAELRIDGDAIVMDATAADLASLNGIKLELTGSLSYVSKRELEIDWSGRNAALTSLPKFCILTVVSTTQISRSMRRVVFSGDNLARFASNTNLHMRLAFPQPGSKPAWPRVDGNGRIVWPEGAARPTMRKYTIRSIDVGAGTLAVDFVVHADAGPGARFANSAKAGDVVGMIGPGGLSVRPADWYLLAGDETALPAIARILEFLPETARGLVLLEVDRAEDEQIIQTGPHIEVRWLHRQGADAGTTTLLADAVRAAQLPHDHSRCFVWAACEYESFKAIRSYLRSDCGLGKDQHLVVSYWRKGKTEDEMEKASDRVAP